MKKLMAISLLCVGLTCGSQASAKSPLAEKRASNISNRMIRGLRLNNYQSSRIKDINLEVAAKLLAAEEAYSGDQAMLEQKIKEIYRERDHQLENVLSTAQYNAYYGSRKQYNKEDREFMASLKGGSETETTASGGGIASANTADNSQGVALN